MTARQRCVCQTSGGLGSSEEAKHPPGEALHFLCRCWQKLRYNEPEYKKWDHQTPFQWKTHCLVPQELCTKEMMLSKEGPRRLYQFRCTWWSSAGKRTPGVCSAVGPTPHHGDWLPEQRKRLGLGWTEKGVGKNPRNTKPNSKLYSANQFLIKKFKVEKTTKYKSFSDAFHYHRTHHL